MSNKTLISNASSYQDIGAFWDKNDATEKGDQAVADFDVNIKSQRRYFPVDSHLFATIKEIANQHGVSEETLLNLWIQEKVNQIQVSAKRRA